MVDDRSMKLLIIDDHPVVRDGLAALLRQLGPEVTVLLAEGASQGLGVADAHPDLDVVILDLAMPGSDGFAALHEFGRLQPQFPVVVLSSSEDPRDVRRALASGASATFPNPRRREPSSRRCGSCLPAMFICRPYRLRTQPPRKTSLRTMASRRAVCA